jgi:hypothetical protein
MSCVLEPPDSDMVNVPAVAVSSAVRLCETVSDGVNLDKVRVARVRVKLALTV